MRRFSSRLERRSEWLAARRLESLGETVNDLFQKATQNEAILRRFQHFELELLDLSSLEQLLDMLLSNSLDYFDLVSAELWLYDPQGTLEALLSDEYLSRSELILTRHQADLASLYSSKPDVRLMSLAGGELPVFSDGDIGSVALLPLCRHGTLVGSLHFGARGQQRFTEEKSTEFIAHLASIIAVCLENVVNHERLHRLSMYDVLTQVKNRRAFHGALEKEISRAARSGDPLSILFVDLDHFKQINDQHGHPMGDKVLKVVAQLIDGQQRKTDHVCRYGGEEFALVLPNCSRQRALEVAERIRLQVSELAIDCDVEQEDPAAGDCATVGVTLSIGVCCWLPERELNNVPESEIARLLIATSDRGVYQSKAAGRNCVHYNSLQSGGDKPRT